jgi:signal transduction histidine kinase
MGVIQGHAQILSDAEDPTLRQAADKIEEKAEELLQTGTKVRKIQEEIQSTPAVSYDTEITRLVNAVTEKFDSEYKYVEINKNIPDDTIRANTPEAYKTALSEMMENAIEHCPKGVAAEIEVTVTVEDERVYTHVKDVCEPIPKEEIEVIKSGKETDLSHASGLGLWLTNWIVETAGGELIFERYSEENRDGNQITILLENLSEESKAEQ